MSYPAKLNDQQHLKQYGYAPGNYMNTCLRCSGVADSVDKYARTCLSCAEAMHAKRIKDEMGTEREWRGLSDEEIEAAVSAWWRDDMTMEYADLARAVEAALKAKNT